MGILVLEVEVAAGTDDMLDMVGIEDEEVEFGGKLGNREISRSDIGLKSARPVSSILLPNMDRSDILKRAALADPEAFGSGTCVIRDCSSESK